MSQSDTIAGLGTRSDYVAAVPNADPARLRLTPEEAALFATVGRASQIQEVLSRSGLSEPRAIAILLSLRAKGAIAPARVTKPSAPAVVTAAMDEQVDLDAVRKKEILDLERVMDGLNHFEVLGLRPGSSAEEVKKAFYEASRRYHPDRFFGKNLGSFRARIDRIFRRLSEADQVLTEPSRRAAYLEAHPEQAEAAAISPPPEPVAAPARPLSPEEQERAEERRSRFARHPYLAKTARVQELVSRARERMAKGEFGHAYTDLHLANQLDERNSEVKALLQEARRKHDSQRSIDELQRAEQAERDGELQVALLAYRTAVGIDSANAKAAFHAARLLFKLKGDLKEAKLLAQRAVDAEPNNVEARVLLGRVMEDAGMKALARRHFEEALRLDPDHAEAKKHLKKRWPF
ncbi:MAG: DnaJ domain-containing protein [Myxococcales bacterium]|nr:DnaJ domain-containing protein [Myxococcales bacterium]